MKNFWLALRLSLITIFAAMACSTAPVKWYRPGTSQETFLHDKAECEEALLSTGTTQRTKDIYTLDGCLEAKGYSAIPLSSQ